MPTDLKPCPNPECGQGANMVPWSCDQDDYIVECCDPSCNMNGPIGSSKAEAARLWNLLPRSPGAAPEGEEGR